MTRDYIYFIHFCHISHRWGRPLYPGGQITPFSLPAVQLRSFGYTERQLADGRCTNERMYWLFAKAHIDWYNPCFVSQESQRLMSECLKGHLFGSWKSADKPSHGTTRLVTTQLRRLHQHRDTHSRTRADPEFSDGGAADPAGRRFRSKGAPWPHAGVKYWMKRRHIPGSIGILSICYYVGMILTLVL